MISTYQHIIYLNVYHKMLNLPESLEVDMNLSSFQLKCCISQIRKYLDEYVTRRLVHALVTSRLDYANEFLYGIPSVHTKKLQLVQITAAILITG